jgi:asparagine synthase (glutamine-hydrolysing)
VDGFFTNHAALATDLGLPAEASPSTIAAGAYERWGEGCLPRLDGQWALILLDVRRGRVLAARDHLGVGQLYFAQHGELVLVASEPKSVAAAQPGGPVPEPVRLGEFLNGFPPATMGLSFFRGVRSVPAGAALHIALSSIGSPTCKTVSYWNPQTLDGWTSNAPPFDDAVLQFEVMLADAVRDRSFDGHSGTLLSGGLDSSVVAALAAECVGPGNPVPSFSILHSDPELTEERWVGAVVRHLGLESHVRTIRPADAWEVVDAVVSAQGEPLLGQDLIGQWLAYTLAAEGGVPAVFDGIGADELLGGVGTESWYVREQLRRGNVIEFARELRALGRRHGVSPIRAARRYLAGPVRRELSWKRHRRRYAWISRELPDDPFAGDLRGDVAPDASLLNRYLYRHVRHQNARAILARLDRCAAAHGVRALVPFLDRRLVEWCLPAPDRYKVFRGQPKRLLHAVARRHLPSEVADRTDKKAIVSGTSWMPLRTTYADAIRSVPLERRVRECGWIDAREAGRFIEAYCAGRHADHLGVWRLYTASRWLELFALG